jgi:hypothetical protein
MRESVIKGLKEARDAIRRKLLDDSEDYRIMLEIESMIDRLTTEKIAATHLTETDRPLSKADAAVELLRSIDKPLSTREVLERLGSRGYPTGGKDPLVNLSSTLSRDKRLHNVRFEGERCWWLANRPLPATGLLDRAPADLGQPEHFVSSDASAQLATFDASEP